MFDLTQALAVAGLVGSALIAGTFYAFSTFVMPALARLAPARGIEAMQTINVTVMHPSVMGVFFGTVLVSIAAVILGATDLAAPHAAALIAGGLLYAVGTFLVTGVGNVPLNNALAAVEPESEAGARLWADYLKRWTRLNHLRTAAATAATVAFALALAA